jgi:uncharacterized membrane protein
MIEHLFEHAVGLAHVLAALAALVLGAVVVALRKGNRRHRWLGRAYLLSMLALNATALSVYELFGGFAPFHGLALFSLATVLSGYGAAPQAGLEDAARLLHDRLLRQPGRGRGR